jgi:molybdate transport system regulatory protein
MTKPNLQLADALGHEVADKRLDILRRIGAAGSISEAARGAGVSYKAAWQAIDTLSNLAGTALLERTVGGSGGGGAQLTPAGVQLLQAAQLLSAARTQVLAQITAQMTAHLGNTLPGAPGLAALGLRTSMRNQLPCRVKALRPQGQAVRVELVLAGGAALFARITRESAELLGLAPGLAVLALCKATAVDVAPAGEPVLGRNRLCGQVTRASRAAGGGEVALALDGGLQVVGFSGPASGLKLRSVAVAYVDESAVVVALPG